MLDLEELVTDCRAAIGDSDPRGAIKELLSRSVHRPGDAAEALAVPGAGLQILYNDADLTVLNVVWPPLMSLYPHDHCMWAAIAIYGGQEDNEFYRRSERTLVPSGGKQLREGDVLLLGDDAVHGVKNPERRYTGAIHVYGGDFVNQPRSQWDPETLVEEPYDLDAVLREFDRAEDAFRAEGGGPPVA